MVQGCSDPCVGLTLYRPSVRNVQRESGGSYEVCSSCSMCTISPSSLNYSLYRENNKEFQALICSTSMQNNGANCQVETAPSCTMPMPDHRSRALPGPLCTCRKFPLDIMSTRAPRLPLTGHTCHIAARKRQRSTGPNPGG